MVSGSTAQRHTEGGGLLVEGTTTKAVSGEAKVSAKLGGGFNLFGNKATAEAATEAKGGKSSETESRPIELDPADVNDIIDALNAPESPKFVVLEDFYYLPEETHAISRWR